MNIEQLVKLQKDYKEAYHTICGISDKHVHVAGMINLINLSEECGVEVIEKEYELEGYTTQGYFYYKDVKFFAIY